MKVKSQDPPGLMSAVVAIFLLVYISNSGRRNVRGEVLSNERQNFSIEPRHVLVLKRSVKGTFHLVEFGTSQLSLEPFLILLTVNLVLVSKDDQQWGGIDVRKISFRRIGRTVVGSLVDSGIQVVVVEPSTLSGNLSVVNELLERSPGVELVLEVSLVVIVLLITRVLVIVGPSVRPGADLFQGGRFIGIVGVILPSLVGNVNNISISINDIVIHVQVGPALFLNVDLHVVSPLGTAFVAIEMLKKGNGRQKSDRLKNGVEISLFASGHGNQSRGGTSRVTNVGNLVLIIGISVTGVLDASGEIVVCNTNIVHVPECSIGGG